MDMNRKLICTLLAVGTIFSAACSKYNYSEEKDIKELAVVSNDYLIGDGGDDCIIPVYANGQVSVSLLEGEVEWARLDKTVLEGDGTLILEVDPNTGARRMVNVLLYLEEFDMRDTVCVRQEGKEQTLSCTTPYITVNGKESVVTELEIAAKNIPAEAITYEVEYAGHGTDWVTSVSIESSKVALTTDANPKYVSRRAKCSLFYVDGWGERIKSDIFITQSDSDGTVGSDILPVEVQAMASEAGFTVLDDLVVEGVIVSDCDSRNMELNPMLDYNVVDSLASMRTAYMQTPDGMNGFRLQFADHQENALRFGTRIKLNLYGCTVTKELDPVRYTISGVGGANLVSAEEGHAPVAKIRKISQLTDQDIYTYVTLTGTEFPLKRGTYLDIREVPDGDWGGDYGQTIDGWATLLIDDEGSAIYAPVNIRCAWRRTGNGLPQGVGNTSGIIVSHEMRRIGDAGRYQIRVIDESGFAQTDQSAYRLHAEWYNTYAKSVDKKDSYNNKNGKYIWNNLQTVFPSTDILDSEPESVANGEMIVQNLFGDPDRAQHIDGGTYYIKHALTGTDDGNIGGVGLSYLQMPTGFYQWDEETKTLLRDEKGNLQTNGWEFTIQNLEGISASDYVFAFDFAGGYKVASVARLYPAHWCVECSVDDGATWIPVKKSITSDQPYVHMRSLPWPKAQINGRSYMTAAEAGMGFTQHAFHLPAAVAGKASFKIGLRPYDDVVTILPFDWKSSTETGHIEYSTTLSGGLRVRFGSIRLYCR